MPATLGGSGKSNSNRFERFTSPKPPALPEDGYLGVAYLLAGRIEEAITAQKQVLIYNPNFLFAYPYLAVGYLLQWIWQLGPDPQTLEQAFEIAQKGIALNDSLLTAHIVLGSVYLWQKQHDQAITEVERTLALDPNLADGYMTLADILSFAGRPEEAIGLAEKAMTLLSGALCLPLLNLGHAYCLTGRYEEAIATLKQFILYYPNNLGAQLLLAVAYSEGGREEEARVAAAKVLSINPNFSLEVMRQRAPHTDPTVTERSIVALRKAGLK